MKAAFCLAFLSVAAASFAEFVEYTVPWEQVGRDSSVVVGLERDVFELGDRVGRFVVAVQVGQAGKIDSATATWKITSGGQEVASGGQAISEGMLVVDFLLDDLGVGEFEVTAEVLAGGNPLGEETRPFRIIGDAGSAPERQGRIPLVFPSGVPETPNGFPVQVAVPFPRGAVDASSTLRVIDADGEVVDAAFQPRATWSYDPAAGVRWMGVDLNLPQSPAWWPDRDATPYFLEFSEDGATSKPKKGIQIQDSDNEIVVDAGRLRLVVLRRGFNGINQATLDGDVVLDQEGKGGPFVVDHAGNLYRSANDREIELTIEESGPLRAVLRAEGWYVREGTDGQSKDFKLPTDALCRFVSRIEIYWDMPFVRMLHTWIQTADSYSIGYQNLGITWLRGENKEAVFGVEDGEAVSAKVPVDGVHLVQHLSDQFEVANGDGGVVSTGEKSNGNVFALGGNGHWMGLANRETWERFPKELEVTPDAVTLYVWPKRGRVHDDIDPYAKNRYHQLWFAHQGELLDLRFPWKSLYAVMRMADNPETGVYSPGGTAMGGVHSSAMGIAITSDVALVFSKSLTDGESIAGAFQQRPTGIADPEWSARTMASGFDHPYDPEHFPEYESAAERAIKGLWDLQSRTGQYGMFLYRGWHHNGYEGDGFWNPYRLYSAGHHQEPHLAWLYYGRSGDPWYLDSGMASMRHLTDLGMIHHADPGYKHVEFYSRQGRLVGSTRHTNGFVLWGGDHAILGHLTSYAGILHAHYLSGDPRFEEVVVDEWQRTLVEDRSNPEWERAARLGREAEGGGGNRDNTNAAGEMVALYRHTFDPRLLALIQPTVDSMEANPAPWGFGLENTLLFRRTPEVEAKLVEAASARRDDAKANKYGLMRAAFSGGKLALASMVDPDARFDLDGALDFSPLLANRIANSFTQGDDVSTPSVLEVPDHFLYLPQILFALNQQGKSEEAMQTAGDDSGQAVYLPLRSQAPGKEPSSPTPVIVRNESGEAFDILLRGVFRSSDASVRVSRDGEVVAEEAIPKGVSHRVSIPASQPGSEFEVLLNLHMENDLVLLPISDQPGEVYPLTRWIARHPIEFFVGREGTADGTITFSPAKNTISLVSEADGALIAEREFSESSEQLVAEIPAEGARLGFGKQGIYHDTENGISLPVALNRARYFVPKDSMHAETR